MGAAGAIAIGAVVGGAYRIERLLGQGGMGSVYEAQHLRLPRRYAVKILNAQLLSNRGIFERFQREAEIASALGHEHIAQVFDFNLTDDGTPYMVLELLVGEDLAARLRRGPLTLSQTVRYLDQLASALTVTHAAGVVHRDLNPRNIFLCARTRGDEILKVLDFGVSKLLEAGTTVTGSIIGTPNYMSPEQAEGRQSDIDPRTDIFSTGAILYECLTGTLAFEAPTALGVLYQVCHHAPAPVRSLAPDIPPEVEAVIDRALAKRRDERFQSMSELRDAMVHACGGLEGANRIPAAT